VLDQPGDLVPVEAVGFDLGHRPGDAELGEPCYAPGAHQQLFLVNGLCRRGPLSKLLNFSITLVINHQS
jgi:hypothetical protein